MDKPCICGKEIMKNRPCWNNEVHCGLPCGKKLKCGSHVCKKTCHKPGDCEDAGIPGSHCAQACGKVRKSCEHTCAEQCHAPYPCKEDKPCQSKTFITCPCQNRKQEVRCMATMLNPSSTRESSLKCDDECLRLQRNRKLADALKIDDTYTDDHIPYSDKTLKMFKENVNWAQIQEREFRVFASSPDEKRLRFKPMPSSQRAFLHSLAEDFGLDSESQDPEPHRHVCIFKTPRFVAAPTKTLAQCARIAKTAASLKPAAAPVVALPKQQQPYNALLLKEPRFGLTIEELDQALAADIKSVAKSGLTAVTFTTNFLPSEEILIRAVPASTAAAIANSSIAPTPQAIESALMTLKTAVSKTVVRLKLATGGVVLCHADDSLNVVRREAESGAGGAGGWNAVAGRGSWKRLGGGPKTSTAEAEKAAAPLTRSFVTLRKIMEKKPVVEVKKEAEPVEEDWLAAVEKEEEEEQEKEKNGASGSDFEGETKGQSKNASVNGDVQEGSGVASDTEQSVDSAAVHEEKEPEPSSVDGGSFSTGEQAETETEIVTAPETDEEAAMMNA
ncbi:FKBP12-associated protein [Neurospora sp. IMI 360204]|nr:FKBP12-associated protein [Neurospora sp. IMI 360204]